MYEDEGEGEGEGHGEDKNDNERLSSIYLTNELTEYEQS